MTHGIEVMGWTLLHFVWQGGIIAIAAAAALWMGRHRSPQVRYVVALAAMAAMLAAPLITAIRLSGPEQFSASEAPGSPASGAAFDAVPAAPPVEPTGVALDGSARLNPAVNLDAALPFLVGGWAAGVTILVLRLAGGCWTVRRLQTAAARRTPSRWQPVANRLALRLGIGAAIPVHDTALVDTPTVAGWLRPVILLPVSAFTNLAPPQIEAILAHELAHVRRHDYAVNVAQTVVETLLFYHPGVWWVSARVREEREHCCDDVAVAVSGDAREYAAALVELESRRVHHTLALAATGAPLRARVRRLLALPPGNESRPAGALIVIALSTLAIALPARSESTAVAAAPAAQVIQAPGRTEPYDRFDWNLRTSGHFDVYYRPEMLTQLDRVAQDAERAYAQVSSDLRHDLAQQIPIVLFANAPELERASTRSLVPLHPSRDRILLLLDGPEAARAGILTHEITHLFTLDIMGANTAPPGPVVPAWVNEGLSEFARGTWNADAQTRLERAVAAGTIPPLTTLNDGGAIDTGLLYALGHAAFEFIEGRHGREGIRRFLFALRQNVRKPGSTDPYAEAFQLTEEAFAREFDTYLKQRFTK
jgi:beta-lactamase regulating signal transducer with metallopeptidase domain